MNSLNFTPPSQSASNSLEQSGVLLAGEGVPFLTDEHRALLAQVATALAGGRAVEAVVRRSDTPVVVEEIDEFDHSTELQELPHFTPQAFATERERREEALVAAERAAEAAAPNNVTAREEHSRRLAALERLDGALVDYVKVDPEHAKKLIWGLARSDYEFNRARAIWTIILTTDIADPDHAWEVSTHLLEDESDHVRACAEDLQSRFEEKPDE